VDQLFYTTSNTASIPAIQPSNQLITMPNAPKRGRGRPRKHESIEEARLAKLQSDRERYYRLKLKPSAQSDNGRPSIPPVLAAPVAAAPKESLEEESAPPQLPSPKEATADDCPPYEHSNQFLDDWDDASRSDSPGSHDGGRARHTVVRSYTRHIDEEREDIYRVSDGEQEQRQDLAASLDNNNDSSQDGSVGSNEIDELASHLQNQTLSAASSAAPSPPPSDASSDAGNADDDSVVNRLVEQLYSFHGCSNEAHNACDAEQVSYTSISDILSFQEPGRHIPDVLSKLELLESLWMRHKLDPNTSFPVLDVQYRFFPIQN